MSLISYGTTINIHVITITYLGAQIQSYKSCKQHIYASK